MEKDNIADENMDSIVIPNNTTAHVGVIGSGKVTKSYGNKSTISIFDDDLIVSNNDKSDDAISDAEFVEVSDDNPRGIHLKDHLYKKNYTKKRHKRK